MVYFFGPMKPLFGRTGSLDVWSRAAATGTKPGEFLGFYDYRNAHGDEESRTNQGRLREYLPVWLAVDDADSGIYSSDGNVELTDEEAVISPQ